MGRRRRRKRRDSHWLLCICVLLLLLQLDEHRMLLFVLSQRCLHQRHRLLQPCVYRLSHRCPVQLAKVPPHFAQLNAEVDECPVVSCTAVACIVTAVALVFVLFLFFATQKAIAQKQLLCIALCSAIAGRHFRSEGDRRRKTNGRRRQRNRHPIRS